MYAGAADGAVADGGVAPDSTVKRIARLALVDVGGGRGGSTAAPMAVAVTSSALARAEERRARRARLLARRACGEDGGVSAVAAGGAFALSDFNAVPVTLSSNYDFDDESAASDDVGDVVCSRDGSDSDSGYFVGRGHDDDDGGVGGGGGGGGGGEHDNDGAGRSGGGRRAGPKVRRLGHHSRSVRFAAGVAPPRRSPAETGDAFAASVAARPRSPPPPPPSPLSSAADETARASDSGMSSGGDTDASDDGSDGSGDGGGRVAAGESAQPPTPCFRCRVSHYPGMAMSRSGLECSCGRGVAPNARIRAMPFVVLEPSAASVLEAARAPPPPPHYLSSFRTPHAASASSASATAMTTTPPELSIIPYVPAPWKVRIVTGILRGQAREQDESMRGADDDGADGDDPGVATQLAGRANGDPDAPSAIAGLGGALTPPSMLLG